MLDYLISSLYPNVDFSCTTHHTRANCEVVSKATWDPLKKLSMEAQHIAITTISTTLKSSKGPRLGLVWCQNIRVSGWQPTIIAYCICVVFLNKDKPSGILCVLHHHTTTGVWWVSIDLSQHSIQNDRCWTDRRTGQSDLPWQKKGGHVVGQGYLLLHQ